MNEYTIAILCQSAVTLFLGIGQWVVGVRVAKLHYKAEAMEKNQSLFAEKQNDLIKQTNGIKSDLVLATQKEFQQKGHEIGVADNKAENALIEKGKVIGQATEKNKQA